MQIDMILGGVFCYVFIDHDVLCTWMDWMFVCCVDVNKTNDVEDTYINIRKLFDSKNILTAMGLTYNAYSEHF